VTKPQRAGQRALGDRVAGIARVGDHAGAVLVERFRLDRRRAPRWRLFGTATLLGLGPNLGMLLELTKLDCSPWWLAGESESCIVVGTKVSVGFSNPACRPNTATVMRCECTRVGNYRIALRFDGAFLC